MQGRPNILFVTPHWPAGVYCGGQQRALNISRLLSRLGHVSFVIAQCWPVDVETVRLARRDFDVRMCIRVLPTARASMLHGLRRRLRHEFAPRYLATVPYLISEADRAALLELMLGFDVVWIHTVNTANLLGIWRWPGSVLDIDDVQSAVYKSATHSEKRLTRQMLNRRMCWIWRRRERLLPERFDVLTVCSEDDRRYLNSTAPTHVIPNGFCVLPERRRATRETKRIGFIGSFPFAPNEEGVNWFIREVWPIIRQQSPQAQLRLVGRGSDSYFSQRGPGIRGLGWLEDPGDEIATWSAMIVPIRVGGGTRVKVAEGFARKCPVVATTMGAFGYDVRNGEEIVLADRANDFASACVRLLDAPELGEAISERAHRQFLQKWTWDSYEGAVGTVIKDCLAASKRKPIGQT